MLLEGVRCRSETRFPASSTSGTRGRGEYLALLQLSLERLEVPESGRLRLEEQVHLADPPDQACRLRLQQNAGEQRWTDPHISKQEATHPQISKPQRAIGLLQKNDLI